jgi:hypothetical protein
MLIKSQLWTIKTISPTLAEVWSQIALKENYLSSEKLSNIVNDETSHQQIQL